MSVNIAQPDKPKTQEWQNSKNINIEGFSLSIGKSLLFEDATLNIIEGNKYGLLGHNGAGKSTLLRAINDRQFHIPYSLTIYYVEQEILNNSLTAVQAVMQADVKNIALLKKESELSRRLEETTNQEEEENLLFELNKVSEALNANNIDSLEPKARRILAGLGFTSDMQNKQVNHFSGGWQMRISLARGLFMEPQLLMLDEPTNHLDLNAVIWLNSYLEKWEKSLILVSHDQDFIANTCNNIINLENKELQYFKGDFYDFRKMYKQMKVQYQKAWDNYQKKITRSA